MRILLSLTLCALCLTACSGGLPSFFGTGESDGTYSFQAETLPDPVQIGLRNVTTEATPTGLIVRVEGFAPTQGYHSAALIQPLSASTVNGVYPVDFVAIPPIEPNAVGPEQTRELRAAVFLPNRYLEDIETLQITGIGQSRTITLQ